MTIREREKFQHTMFGDDDHAFRRAQKRKRRGKYPMNPPPETGPCCLRCPHWTEPGPQDDYGTCALLVITTDRHFGVDRGIVFGIESAIRGQIALWEYLPTGPGFACSRFNEAWVRPETEAIA